MYKLNVASVTSLIKSWYFSILKIVGLISVCKLTYVYLSKFDFLWKLQNKLFAKFDISPLGNGPFNDTSMEQKLS